MQEDGLVARARKRYTDTTMSNHDQPVAANLLDRQFEAEAVNQRWVGDTTEFVIGDSGKLYLAAVPGQASARAASDSGHYVKRQQRNTSGNRSIRPIVRRRDLIREAGESPMTSEPPRASAGPVRRDGDHHPDQ